MKKRLTALLLVMVMVMSLAPQALAESIEDYPNGVNVLINGETPHTYLDIKSGDYSWGLSARIWSYLTADGKIKGPAYCTSHGSGYPNGYIAVDTTPYTANPAMTGAFSSGYPLVSLETFTALHPEVSGLTKDEYGYATQVAIWAALGQVSVEGTSYTSGAENVFRPEDPAKLRVYNAVVAILGSTGSGGTSVGMRIRDAAGSDNDTVDLGSEMSLSMAAATNTSGIKTENIGGKQYYTREFVLTCTSMPDSGSVTLQVSGAPAGTVLASASNQVLSDGAVTLTSSGTGYSGTFKICVPADAAEAETAGSVTVQAAAAVASCSFYKVDNSHAYEQDFILADPNSSTSSAAGYLKWGESGTTTTDTGSIRLLKTGENGEALAGAEFDIDGSAGYHDSGTTGADGSITWTDLPVGQGYTITETLAPEGFQLADPISVAAKAGQTVYVTVTDSSEKTFRVHKQDKQSGLSLEGAVFRFEQIDGDFVTEGRTGADGLISFTPDKLPYGAYRVFELSAPETHEKDNTVKTVNWDGKADIDLYFTNVRKAGFKILKVDSLTNLPLSGAYFDVYKDGALIDTVRTNEQGIATVSGVSEGYYECVERIAPYGYVLSTERFGIHVDPYDPATSEDPVLRIPNKRMPALRIVKYDAQTMQPLANVTFAVYKDTELIGEYPTDNRGEIYLYDLEPGTYTVQEIAGPDSHVVNSTPQSIELEAGTTQTYTLIFFNYLKPGIHLRKVDSQTLEPLPNVRFRITQVGGTFSQEYTTDPNGEIDLTGLDPGTYTVVELAGLDHYLIDDAERIIKIEGGDNAEFIFTNTKKPSFRLVKIDSLTGERLPGATFRIARIADGSHYLDRVTDINGEINISDLEPGVFSVQELAAPDKYILDTTEYHVELFPGQTSQLVISNDVKPDLRIVKMDADTGEYLEGAVFKVRRADGPTLTAEETNEKGEIILRGLDPAVYEISEELPPVGYLPARQSSQLITLTPNKLGTVIFTNHAKPTLTVNKISSVSGEALKGAKFHVTYRSNNTETGAMQDLGNYLTDDKGQFKLEDLTDGWYTITELESVPGYSIKEATQEVYIRGGEDRVLTFENIPLSALVVYKYDSVTGEAVAGARFQVRKLTDTSGTGGTVIGTYTTGPNGSFTVTGLSEGTYIVEEIASDGDHVIDTAPQTVYISGKQTDVVEISFGNSPKGSVLIKKIDSVTHEPLSDVEFLVTDSKGRLIGNANGKFVTDSAGTILINNLDPSTTLVVKESRAKSGYVMDDVPQTVEVQAGKTVTLEFRNTPCGSLLVQKIDSVTKEPLPGAEFRITTSDGTLVDSNGGLTSSNGLYVTDDNGQIFLTGLKPATYLISETRAPDNYRLAASPTTVVVRAADTQTVTIADDPLCTLTILKRDASTKEPLRGAEFLVKYSDGTVVGPNNGRYTTGSDGTVTVSGLKPDATVVVTEQRAPTGYLKDDEAQTIVVRSGVANSLVFDNEPTTTLVIRKYIKGTDYEPLAGVGFKVTDGNGGDVGPDAGIYYTDASGEIVLSGLEPGLSVTVREISTKDGFVLDGTPQTILIQSGVVQHLTFWNERQGSLTVRKLDSVTKEPLEGATFKITYADGRPVDTENGQVSSGGMYTTNCNGEINITGITGTLLISEERAPDGYSILTNCKTKAITVNPGDGQTVIFYNDPHQTLVIEKYVKDSTVPVPGTEFLVTDSAGTVVGPDNGKYVTDENGRVVISGLEPGITITAKETRAADGFTYDGTPKSIKIVQGEVQHLQFYDTPKQVLVIQKFVEGTEVPIQGVKFLLTDGSGKPIGGGNGEYVTDSTGRIMISGLDEGTTVIAKEIRAGDGFALNSEAQSIVIRSGALNVLTFYDEPLGVLVINKYIQGTDYEPLSGVAFEVTDGSGAKIGPDNGVYYTDKQGQIRLENLELNATLTVKEVATVDGFVLDGTPQTVKIHSGLQNLTFWNRRTGSLTIRKLDSVTKEPLFGVTFKITYADGRYVDNLGGKVSSNGLYYTDQNGEIVISGVTGTLVVTEEQTIEGYTIDEGTRTQTVTVNPDDGQVLTFFNTPIGGVELIKVNAADRSERIPNTTFEIRRIDDALVDTVTTDRNGRVFVALDEGSYYAVEIAVAEGFKLDATPTYFEVKAGKTTTKTITNEKFSGLTIHKIDSQTRQGIYGVTFVLYDSGKTPIEQMTTDQYGYARTSKELKAGQYFLRELEAAEGYVADTQYKTVFVEAGKSTTIEWENTPITAQIQITKYAAENNTVTGQAKGTTLQGAVYEIVRERSGVVVATIVTDARGVAASPALPLGRYLVREVTAPAYWQLSEQTFDVTLEYPGQIIKLADYDKPAELGVTITKRGVAQALAASTVKYDITVANTSNVPLESFFWHDRIPTDVATAMTLTTGTYSARLNYRILYKTNYNQTYQVLASNLLTTNNYSFALNAIPMQYGEKVTDVYFDFGKVPVGFQSVTGATLSVIIAGDAANGYQMINRADVGGKYSGTWETGNAGWVTGIMNLNPRPTLPKTGY